MNITSAQYHRIEENRGTRRKNERVERCPYHIIEDKIIALPRTPSIYGHLVWKKSNVAHRLAKREREESIS